MTAPADPTIAERLGEQAVEIIEAMRAAAPRATEAYIEYVWASALAGMITAAFFMILAIVSIPYGRVLLAKDAKVEQNLNEGGWIACACLVWGLGIVAALAAVFLASGNIAPMIAPEGAAIARLLSRV